MKAFYDFHIHSCLSPCGGDDATPLKIVAMASAKGLHAIALCDHNAIDNVEVAQKFGEMLDVVVIPAMELQTNEEIHILTFFENYRNLKSFYDSVEFQYIENKEEIFGRQLIVDEDDKIRGKVKRLLVTSAKESIYQIIPKVKSFGGLVYLAHIDRESNGILNILGDIPSDIDFDGVEFTHPEQDLTQYISMDANIIINSDAHNIDCINEKVNHLEVEKIDISTIFKRLKK